MMSTCGDGSPLRKRRERCATPNRCCSSTTTRPRRRNFTGDSTRACVPIRASIEPAARAASRCRRGAPRTRPVSSPRRTPAPVSQDARLSACCSARISVGAMRAACAPFLAASRIARPATIVLPEPTSPWRSRAMARPEPRSSAISRTALFWAPVNGKGRAERASLRIVSSAGRARPGRARSRARRSSMRAARVRSSSAASSARAGPEESSRVGKCASSRARRSVAAGAEIARKSGATASRALRTRTRQGRDGISARRW